MLLAGTASDGPQSGSVRTTRVFIGAGNRRVNMAWFVPPPLDHRLLDGLSYWERWVREGLNLPISKLLSCTINSRHCIPFMTAMGVWDGWPPCCNSWPKAISGIPLEYFALARAAPGRVLSGVAGSVGNGDWNQSVSVMGAAIHSESLEVVARVDNLLALREVCQRTLPGSKGVSLRIADDLIGYPVITASLASRLHGVSYQAANTAIAKLVD